jgi:uncharacterized protein involved in oxidation of intracellular sulfur
MANAVGCAVAGQRTPIGYYNLERLASAADWHDAEIGLCGSCMDTHGVDEGARTRERSSRERAAQASTSSRTGRSERTRSSASNPPSV